MLRLNGWVIEVHLECGKPPDSYFFVRKPKLNDGEQLLKQSACYFLFEASTSR